MSFSLMQSTHQDNELNQALAAHQTTDSQAFAPQELVGAGGKGSTDDLAEKGTHDDADDICPGNAVTQEAQVGVQARQSKVERQEQNANEIFDLLGQFDGETAVVRADDADQKGPENGMNANDTWEVS
jgi:hypothetical protein